MDGSSIPDFPKSFAHLVVDCVTFDYSRCVIEAGGVPVLIPRGVTIAPLLDRVDGIVLSGGEDVTPALHGSDTGPYDTRHDLERDIFEMSLITEALNRHMPILAICRGIQILNVALGGTLVSHLAENNGYSHQDSEVAPHVKRQGVFVEAGSRMAHILVDQPHEGGSLVVNSFHHQAILTPSPSIRVVAWADDGTIEGVEMPHLDVLGVQWHPELHEGLDPVFTWFNAVATKFAARRRKESRHARVT